MISMTLMFMNITILMLFKSLYSKNCFCCICIILVSWRVIPAYLLTYTALPPCPLNHLLSLSQLDLTPTHLVHTHREYALPPRPTST